MSRLATMKDLVKQEAKNLKKLAFKTELKKLNFERLNSKSPRKCIYGQMSGNCYSKRAGTLIQKCALRVYKTGLLYEPFREAKLNGSPEEYAVRISTESIKFHSPIEVFIAQNNENQEENNKRLIRFLKDKTKTLNFL